MSESWTCQIINEAGAIELSELDGAGREWFADGPGGAEIGDLHLALTVAAGPDADATWLAMVEAVVTAELGSVRRLQLLAKPMSGRWFHATFVRNRQSIRDHGLDCRRLVEPGIAGSRAAEAEAEAEADGIFPSSDLGTAHWFARQPPWRGRHLGS